jgi:hypothetical protein
MDADIAILDRQGIISSSNKEDVEFIYHAIKAHFGESLWQYMKPEILQNMVGDWEITVGGHQATENIYRLSDLCLFGTRVLKFVKEIYSVGLK